MGIIWRTGTMSILKPRQYISADIQHGSLPFCPAGTPYENGTFRMKLLLSHDFPRSPPKGYFMTKIFHPNIAANGEICVNTLKRDWNPSLGLRHVLVVIRCLLIEPFPESALNEQAGKMLLEDYEEYARHARLYTGIHALKKPKSKTGAISECTTALNVDQSNPGEPARVPVCAAVSREPGLSELDRNTVGAPVMSQKKGGASIGTLKAQADRKKVADARKKSLKRL